MSNGDRPASDMTKREMIAMEAMVAIIGKKPFEMVLGTEIDEGDRRVACGAVCYANALLDKLDTPRCNCTCH